MTLTITPPAPATSPDPDDETGRYAAVLDQVDATMNSALQAARAAYHVPRAQRERVLADLHTRVRSMGLLLNEALGGWPPPPAADEAP
ncbi:hypothetical protein AB0M46_13695 [Dactylosporangium sp. NPDC051485]|uniref:hypothetical protein n=1 Tax=Dactylosporangium sp. NPDC051485 TaxID=3154846 RepID=UPI003437FF84